MISFNIMSNMNFSTNFTLNKTDLKTFHESLEKCGDKLDLQGWRYSKDLGINEYTPIQQNESMTYYQYKICISFLKHFFSKASKIDTVTSFDLREAAELWWSKTYSESIYIDNGIMLLAIVSRGLAPIDLWFSMDLNQQAKIPVSKWNDFCAKYNYITKIQWTISNDDDCGDVLKIN